MIGKINPVNNNLSNLTKSKPIPKSTLYSNQTELPFGSNLKYNKSILDSQTQYKSQNSEFQLNSGKYKNSNYEGKTRSDNGHSNNVYE